MIPGLEQVEFVRLGSMHRNTFINAPALLLPSFQLKQEPRLFFAGQISGVEGYVESAASGFLAGWRLARACLVTRIPPTRSALPKPFAIRLPWPSNALRWLGTGKQKS